MKITYLFLFVLILAGATSAACQVISSPGEYQLTADTTGAPYSVSVSAGISEACIVIASENVHFSCNGFTITNDGTSDAAGVVINGSDTINYENVTVEGCTISEYEVAVLVHKSINDTISNTIAYTGYTGLWVMYSDNSTLANNTAYDYSYGIRATGGSDNLMQNNTIYDISLIGYMITTSSDYNTIIDGTEYNSTLYGLLISDGIHNNVSNNVFHDNANFGLVIMSTASAYNYIGNNTIYNNGNYGIGLINTTNNELEGNLVYENAVQGIALDAEANGNNITGNTIRDNHNYGIYSYGGSFNNTFNGNYVYNNVRGLRIASSNNNTVGSNIVYNNSNYGLEMTDGDASITGNFLYDNTNYGCHISGTNNLMEDNTAYQNGIGFVVASDEDTFTKNILYNNTQYQLRVIGDNNSIYDNNFTAYGTQIVVNASAHTNYWNTTYTCTGTNIIGGDCIGGNYYSNYTWADTDADGIGEIPYSLYGNTDYLPLTLLSGNCNNDSDCANGYECISWYCQEKEATGGGPKIYVSEESEETEDTNETEELEETTEETEDEGSESQTEIALFSNAGNALEELEEAISTGDIAEIISKTGALLMAIADDLDNLLRYVFLSLEIYMWMIISMGLLAGYEYWKHRKITGNIYMACSIAFIIGVVYVLYGG